MRLGVTLSFRKPRPAWNSRQIVASSSTCTFLVYCSLTNEYQYSEARWKALAQEWMSGHRTAPLTHVITSALASRVVRITTTRSGPISASVVKELAISGTPAQAIERIETSCHCIAVQVIDELRYPRSGLWAAYAAAQAIASRVHGTVVDVDSGRIVPETVDFSQLHLAGVPSVRHFVSVLVSPSRSGVHRLTTRGMLRFGAPDLELLNEDLLPEPVLVEILYAAAQTLASEIMTSLGCINGGKTRVPADILLDPASPWIPAVRMSNKNVATECVGIRLRQQSRPRSLHRGTLALGGGQIGRATLTLSAGAGHSASPTAHASGIKGGLSAPRVAAAKGGQSLPDVTGPGAPMGLVRRAAMKFSARSSDKSRSAPVIGPTQSLLALRPPTGYPDDARAWLHELARVVAPYAIAAPEPEAQTIPPVSRKELEAARSAYDGDVFERLRFCVRYRIATADGFEYQWVRVTHWEHPRVRGYVVATPIAAPDILGGNIAEVEERDIVQIDRADNLHPSRYTGKGLTTY